jgi:hypothetical protein
MRFLPKKPRDPHERQPVLDWPGHWPSSGWCVHLRYLTVDPLAFSDKGTQVWADLKRQREPAVMGKIVVRVQAPLAKRDGKE